MNVQEMKELFEHVAEHSVDEGEVQVILMNDYLSYEGHPENRNVDIREVRVIFVSEHYANYLKDDVPVFKELLELRRKREIPEIDIDEVVLTSDFDLF